MSEKAGLYIHIPFCKNKCPYCDFYSTKYSEDAAENCANEIIAEMKKYSGQFDTVYFGGGTPNILPPEIFISILDECKNNFEIDSSAEITVECNPSFCTEEMFLKYASAGVNRISIGMQSAVDSERFALGRTAGREQVSFAVSSAKKVGIYNISLDIMLGTPKQTLGSLDVTLDFISKIGVSHISAYMLKIEPNTPFFRIKDRLDLPDDEVVADMYLHIVDKLAEMGFEQYEISNFAKRGFESRHNLKYWRLVPYLGLGRSAHSFWGGKRFFYNNDFVLTDDGCGGSNEEKIMLGLRLNEGIDKHLITKNIKPLLNAGLLVNKNGKIALTPNGMLVSNTIISELI